MRGSIEHSVSSSRILPAAILTLGSSDEEIRREARRQGLSQCATTSLSLGKKGDTHWMATVDFESTGEPVSRSKIERFYDKPGGALVEIVVTEFPGSH